MRGKRWIQKITAAALAAAVAVSLSGTGFAKETVVYAAEEAAQAAVPQVLPQPTPEEAYAAAGFVRSVYTNEWIPAEQAGVRPIAVMMPTDRIAQPSYGISNAKILYEKDRKREKLPCLLSARGYGMGPDFGPFWRRCLYEGQNNGA